MIKKILLLFLSFFICTQAHAGLITVNELSEDADISNFNKAFQTIKNEINGELESVNIKNDTIAEVDLADEINAAIREGDHFNAYTVTGHEPATSTAPDLDSDISAGTSYIKSTAGKLFRQETAATNHTYIASRDTWVYIDINGTFQFVTQTLGQAEPSAPADSLKLAKVVTDADNITSVVDERTLTISLTTTEDFYLKGMIIHADNADIISVDTGVIRHGTTLLGKTAFTNMTLATATNWHDGVVDTGAAAFYYIGIDGSGNIRFLGNDPPDKHDTLGNSDPPLYYSLIGSTYWRVIGQIRVDASNNIQPHFQQGNEYRWDVPFNETTTPSAGSWSSALDCSSSIPSTSTTGIFGLSSEQGSATVGIHVRPNGSTWATDIANGIHCSAAGATTVKIGGQRESATDTSQQIQYRNESGDTATRVDVEGYIDNLRD